MTNQKQNRYPVHGDCANFRNEICILNGASVDPNGAACPRFTPKNITKMPQETLYYPEPMRYQQQYLPRRGQEGPISRRGLGFSIGGLRRMRLGGMGRTRGGIASGYYSGTQKEYSNTSELIQEKQWLKNKLRELENQLRNVRKQLDEIDDT